MLWQWLWVFPGLLFIYDGNHITVTSDWTQDPGLPRELGMRWTGPAPGWPGPSGGSGLEGEAEEHPEDPQQQLPRLPGWVNSRKGGSTIFHWKIQPWELSLPLWTYVFIAVFYNFPVIFFLPPLAFKGVLFNFHIVVMFPVFLQLLILVSFHCGQRIYLVWFLSFKNLLRPLLWPNIWSTLFSILQPLKKKCADFRWGATYMLYIWFIVFLSPLYWCAIWLLYALLKVEYLSL